MWRLIESNSNSISPSDSKAQLMLQSDVDSDSDGNFDEKISSRWANKFEMNTLDNESVGSPANASQVSPDKLTVQHEESSDDSVQEKKKRKPLPSKSLEFILKHKVFQQFESKKIVTEEIDNVSPARLIQAITPTSKDVGSGSKLIPELGNSDDDGDDDETDSLVSSDSDVLDYEDVLFADEVKATNSNAYFADYNGRRTAVGVTGGWMETQPKKRKIRSKEERIADSVRQNFKELKDPYQSLNTKKKNALLQEAVSVVPNHNYKKKKGHRFTDMLSKFHAKPTLAYVPSLDGGVYFTALAHANVPRSYYELCSAKFLCGFCMCFFSKNRKAIDEDDILRLSFSTAERKRKLNANKKARTIDPYTAIIDEYVGVVKMPLHYRCAYTLNKKTYQDYSKNGNASGIRIKSIHEYQYADDIACDLCGRQGGIIARFSISKGVSTRVTPRENGWYGHLPCIHFLRQSNFLLRDTTLARNSSYCYGYPKLTNQHRYDNPIREEVEKRMSAMGMISERPDERTQLLMEETNEELPEETDTPEKPLFSTSISIVPTEVTALMDELIGEVAERHEIRAVLDAIIDEVVSSTEEDDAMEETEDKDEGAKEADEDSVSDTSSDSESYRTIDRSIPLCRFDVVMDKYRCTLCGQHNGLVLRCAARNCLIRAHPLCAQLQENEFYSLRFLQEEKESCDVAHNTNIGIVFLCCLHGVNLHRT